MSGKSRTTVTLSGRLRRTSEMFKKYMHVERLSGAYNPEINGLLNGTVYVFPKLDGEIGRAHV